MSAEMLKRARGGEFLPGTWMSIGSPVIAELAARCGFGWILFDLEHGCSGMDSLLGGFQAVEGHSTLPIVRVPAAEGHVVSRVLDWGARGIMFPHVESAEEARQCVRLVHYPPLGKRGYSRSVRTHAYGLRPPEEGGLPLVIVQIESVHAVKEARAIARVEGVDILFVGPADLQFDISLRSAGAEYMACLAEVLDSAREAEKPAGLLLRDASRLTEYRALGFRFLAIDSDLGILREGYRGYIKSCGPTGL